MIDCPWAAGTGEASSHPNGAQKVVPHVFVERHQTTLNFLNQNSSFAPKATPTAWSKPRKVFVDSMLDLFHPASFGKNRIVTRVPTK
jgi:hypothetical protein